MSTSFYLFFPSLNNINKCNPQFNLPKTAAFPLPIFLSQKLPSHYAKFQLLEQTSLPDYL